MQGVSEQQGGFVPTSESLKLPACQGTQVEDFYLGNDDFVGVVT